MQLSELKFLRKISIFYSLPDIILDTLRTLIDKNELQKIQLKLKKYKVSKDEYGFTIDPLLLLGLDLVVWMNAYFNYAEDLPKELKGKAKGFEGYSDLHPDTNFLINSDDLNSKGLEVSKELLFRTKLEGFMCDTAKKYPEEFLRALLEVCENENLYPIENSPDVSILDKSFE
jgi:hypothetical protein